mgnify:CR=1 FL=1
MEENNIAYFDNAATTFPKPEEVYSFMDSFYRTNGVNLGRGASSNESSAASLQKETRELLLKLFHCPLNKTVIFQPSATQALNLIIRGFNWSEGDTIYISPFEHNAVLRPLNYLKEKLNLQIIQLAVDKDSITYNLEKIKYQFQENKPRAVIVSHASNVCGVIAPIKEIFAYAKKYNSLTIADMSQTAGLIDTNLIESNVDYAVFAGHKTLYGPFGIAGFVSTTDVNLDPLIYGGTGIESANPLMPDLMPIKYEAGSANIQAIAGLNAALKWIFQVGIDQIYKTEQKNTELLLNILRKYDFIHIIKPRSDSVGVVSFNIDNYSSESLSEVFSNNGIACRTGLHCSPLAHDFLGTSPGGTIRFSVGYFLTDKDLRKLCAFLDEFSQEY